MTPDEFDALPMAKKKSIRSRLSELGKAACEYAEMGFYVFPLAPKTKVPQIENGYLMACDDWEVCCWWWAEHPDSNIGVATGATKSGIMVIDVDCDESKGKYGDESLEEWESANGKLPETVCADTGSGGKHYLFRISSALPSAINQTLCIDVKSEGGYIVAPPSIHPNGNAYYWDLDPYDYDIAPLDDLVMRLYASIKGGADDSETPNGCTPGNGKFVPRDEVHDGEGRESELVTYAFSLRSQGLEEPEIFETLKSYNEASIIPPKPIRDIRRIARSAAKKPAGLSPEYQAAKDRAERRKADEAEKAAQQFEDDGESDDYGIDPADYVMGRNGLNHAKAGQDMIERFHVRLIDGAPAIWEENHYSIGWDEIKKRVSLYKPTARESERMEVIKWLSLYAPRVRHGNWRYVSFINGTIDIGTGELIPNDPKNNVTNLIPHEWNPNAESDVVDQTLWGIACGKPDVYANLCEIIGACLCRSTFLGKGFFIVNSQGSNGKSTFLNLLRGTIGRDNCSSLQLQNMGKRFQSTAMIGKLANIADDIPPNIAESDSLSVFKTVVTGDVTPYEIKGGITDDFEPYCTCVFTMNEMPRLGEISGGMLRRFHFVEFAAHFSGENENKMLRYELDTEEAYQYAIKIGVDAMRKCIERSDVTHTAYSLETTNDIELENNSILRFVSEKEINVAFLTSDMMSSETLYEIYVDWANDSGLRNVFERARFTKRICSIYNLSTKQKRIGTRRMRVFEVA